MIKMKMSKPGEVDSLLTTAEYEDFTKADNENRRIGAYLRLAFYYPAEVETLVLKELAKPTYDVFAVRRENGAALLLYPSRA